MALNKRKVLDAARKFAQKGAKAKALKEYQKLLQADPRDAKLLLEVGDAYRRWGQAEEAIAQYSKVAQQYRQDGFDARAVAVFKQILNLDPKHYSAYVSLAELYQRMGLDSEAISALQTAADGYHKEGRKTDALELLRQMAALDPTNTTSRLKVAELLRQEGMTQEALVEYQAVAEELESQQERDQLITVLERILETKPDHLPSLTSLVRQLVAAGAYDRAEPLAVRALNASADPTQYELLIDLYARSGDEQKLADATRGLAKLYRDRGDEDKARELLQRLPVPEMGSGSRLAVDVSEMEDPEVSEHELLADEPFLALDDDLGAGGLTLGGDDDIELTLEADDEIPLETEAPPAARPKAAASAKPAKGGAAAKAETLPEGDPDQLLAEANVYLRYGKSTQAIASLRGILAQDPDHRGALEKLGEAYADAGRGAEAVDVWTRAAQQVFELGDGEALSILRDRIAAIDPAAAAAIPDCDAGGRGGADASDAMEDEPGLDLDVEVDLEESVDPASIEDTEVDAGGFELDLDDGMDFDDELGPVETGRTGLVDETAQVFDDDSVGGDASFELEIDFDEDETEDDDAATSDDDGSIEIELEGFDSNEEALAESGPQSTTSAARIAEELEEAEFYIAQDMYDEAEGVLQRILELAPNHPSAMLRLGEIAAARGNAPDRAVPEMEPLAAEATSGGFDISARFEEEDETLTASPDELDDDDDDAGFSVEVDFDDDDEDESEDSLRPAPPSFSADESDDDSQDWDSSTAELTAPTEPAVAGAQADVPVGLGDPSETFDLREALADVLSDDDQPAREAATSGVLSTVEDGFESIFSDFKKGVSATLEEGDYDTRYDLGIAYREMELFEDAIAEFRVCLDSPARRFDSLYLMGLCARDLGRFDDAVNHLEQALALPELPEDRMAGVYFDLSIAQEGAGDLGRARAMIERVLELEPGFPGASERRAALASGSGAAEPQLATPADEFESFDELFDDAGDDSASAPVMEAGETFESFDDVLSEAEAVLEQADAEGEDSSSGETGRRGGRKKISFV
ncbi:MAG: tetratricopeptide repeat protein [Spirochaetaceae bacterium]|nr:tetratricopeptide repeat protein [Spirochaetaceae bacterium]